MCGLVGVAGKLEARDEPLLQRLLLADYFRGKDSTGLAAVRGDGNIHVAKIASHPIDLFDTERFKKTLSGYNSKVFLGHNRFATKGKVNGANAHPFHYGEVVGAHNGTLSYQSWRALEKELGQEFDVDSQAVIAAIAQLGIEATVPLLQGAWALTWYDASNNTLNFLRNSERPLWYAFSEAFDRIIWASEWPMIDAAVKMASSAQTINLYHDKEFHRFWQITPNLHYKFDMAEFKKPDGHPKPVVVERKGKEPEPAAYSGKYDPFDRGANDCGWVPTGTPAGYRAPPKTVTNTPNSGKTSSTTTSPSDKQTVLNLYGTKSNPTAGLIDFEKFSELAKYGCSWCAGDVAYDDVGYTIFERDDVLLCSECSHHDRTKDEPDHNRIVVRSLEGMQ